MLFSSMTFIFMFLPILCGLYLLFKKEYRNALLLIASILFYAWGEPKYVVVMLLTIAINYFGALFIDRFKCKKLILTGTIILNLSFLFYFKYFNFFIDNINTLFSSHINVLKVIMPIGISFYTFQAMSYVIDVFRGEVKVQKDIYKLALYITLFPQLVAGPIVKYHDIKDQIDNRQENFDKVCYGVKRFILGLSKKMLIANTLGAVADKIFEQPVEQFDTLIAWLGAIAYSFQLFYDFSGYSDMAIGLGSIFGFKFLENFNYPYISKSITEFWRRWHISLSAWFKEYLYIPLGGNRKGRNRTYLNLFLVFLATGFWHGAEWTFIVWGLWHGFFIIMERLTGIHKTEGTWKLKTFQHLYTIFAFVIGWVIFRAKDLSYAWDYIKNMFGVYGEHKLAFKFLYYMDNLEVMAFIMALLCACPIFKNLLTLKFKNQIVDSFVLGIINIWLLLCFIISWAFIAASTYNPFIYFRF